MLVLERKDQEKIQIGDDITIQVTRIRGDKVRIGIAAPKEMVILRGEVKDNRKGADRDD